MTYQQWNHQHHYQAIPESRPLLMQPWQHEFGCPVPRPRSFSLGSRPTGPELLQISSKRMYDTSPQIILPVDSNQNYCYSSNNNRTSNFNSKRHSRKCGWALVFILLLASGLSILAWWKLRRSASIILDQEKDYPPVPAQQHYQPPPPPPVTQQQQQSAYHPLPPPPAALVPPGTQQQYYAMPQQPTGWQQPQQQQQQQHYQHVPPVPVEAQRNYQPQQYQQQQQQQYNNPQYSYPQQYQQPHYGQPPQINPHHAQHYANHQPDVVHHQGEQVPRKSWMMEHVDNPVAQNEMRHQQQQQPQQPQQQQIHQQPKQQSQQSSLPSPPPPPPPPPHVHHHQKQQQQQPPMMEPVLSRQEERAKARNQARTMNPKKNSSKVQNEDDNIWEQEEKVENDEVAVEIPLRLRLEPAQFSFSESVLGSDGTVFITSFEDDEDVTVEVIEEA